MSNEVNAEMKDEEPGLVVRTLTPPSWTNDSDADALFLNEDGHVDFAPEDLDNPKNWSPARRWYIVIAALILALNATYASSSPTGCFESIAEDLHVSVEAAGLVITLFLLGYCFGPLFWGPLSEFYGRRVVFLITFTLYLAFGFLCAFTPNFAGLLVGRFLTGSLVSSTLSNSPAVMADLLNADERGIGLALFAVITLAGPALGPIVSGFLQLKLDWRWSFYVLLWLAGGSFPFLLSLPETHPPTILLHKARRARRENPRYEHVMTAAEARGRSLRSILRVALTRPWTIFFDLISFLFAIYSTVAYTLLYMLFEIFPVVFQQKRGWNSGVGELPLLSVIIGGCMGGTVVCFQALRERKKTLTGWKRVPEDRLPVMIVAGFLFPISMFWFAWSGEYNGVPWIVVTLAATSLVFSLTMIMVSCLSYLVDCYLMYAASAMAVNTVCRSAGGAASPLFTQYMYNRLGVGGGGSLVGGIAILLAVVPVMFYKYGDRIRKRSKFSPTGERK
ncbi:putative MFS-type transporter [Fonsecaea erecta]|uniref:Putative MFS-type transporter n=1 Tax=Fonsecaea erecta TaxID=1367422 RepID=A0A178ZKW4_9EURO|nr:putative MFS-type transporter [Fonsecaea erecta]OAP60427.1 putative MFS-type transporter [Fonsecaea erecta]